MSATAGDGYAIATWLPPPDGGSPITAYVVSAYVGATPVAVAIVGPSATTGKVSGLTDGTTYRLRVRAFNAVGGGAFSGLSGFVTPHVVNLSDLAGSFTGTAVFRFGVSGCQNVDWQYGADYVTANRVAVTMSIEVCETDQLPNTNDFAANGTFTISTSSGTITGTVTGSQGITANGDPIQLVLSPTAGTGVFMDVPTESVVVDATLGLPFTAGEGEPGSLAGTVIVP